MISPGHSTQLPVEEWNLLERERIRFVLALGRALHHYGTPAHRLEEIIGCCHDRATDPGWRRLFQ